MALEDGERFAALGAADVDDALEARPVEIGDEAVADQRLDGVHGAGEQRIEFGMRIQIGIQLLAVRELERHAAFAHRLLQLLEPGTAHLGRVVHEDHGAHALRMAFAQAVGELVVAEHVRRHLLEDAHRREHAQQAVGGIGLGAARARRSLATTSCAIGQHGGDVQPRRDVQRARLPVGRADLHEAERRRRDLVGEVLQPGAESCIAWRRRRTGTAFFCRVMFVLSLLMFP